MKDVKEKKSHSTGVELRGKIYSRKQYPIRPEVNYNMPPNRLRVPQRLGKSSPKYNRNGFPDTLTRQIETERKYGKYVSLYGKTIDNLLDGKEGY